MLRMAPLPSQGRKRRGSILGTVRAATAHLDHRTLGAKPCADGGIADQILRNAPLTEGPYFAVPKVVE